MKAWQIDKDWGYDNFAMVDLPKPTVKKGFVLVKVHCISLNYRDHLVINGHYNPRYPIPLVPCSDSAGEVVEVGEGVAKWQKGDRVMNLSALSWFDGLMDKDTLKNTMGGPLPGTLQEYLLLPEEALVAIPEHLDYEQAATLPCAGLTAFSALFTHGNIKADEKLLVLGTGGVSIFALQFAKMMGAFVIATSSSDDKINKVKELGADALINYRKTPDWEKEVLEITSGKGVDHVIEVGGAGTLTKSLKSVRPGGQVYLIGVLAGGASSELSLLPVLMFNIKVQGIFVGHKKSFLEMNDFISEHKIRPVVDRVFDFKEARQAFDHLSHGRHFGKIVIRVSD